MAQKTIIDLKAENVISGGSSSESMSPPVPSGIRATLTEFGGANIGSPEDAFFTLHWGHDSLSWELIRAGSGTFSFTLNKTFIGDGLKRFRLRRINNGLTSRTMIAWMEGVLQNG